MAYTKLFKLRFWGASGNKFQTVCAKVKFATVTITFNKNEGGFSMKFSLQYKLNDLFKHRFIWMGVAMLWIIFFHFPFQISFLPLRIFKIIGYGGVDIFLFASGLGCYFSYSKNRNPLTFIKRRISRLAPVYLPFIVVWVSYQYFSKKIPLQAAIGNVFAVQGFTNLGNDFNWYITGLILCYILTPFFFEIIEKTKKWAQLLGIIALLLMITITFWNTTNEIIIVTRLPIFAIGMYFAKMSEGEHPVLTLKSTCYLFLTSVVGFVILGIFILFLESYLWSYGLYWYPFILITPGLCIFISIISETMMKYKITRGFILLLKSIGEYSFELYLVHIFCLNIYEEVIIPTNIIPDTNLSCLLVIIAIIPLILLLRGIAILLKKLWNISRAKSL